MCSVFFFIRVKQQAQEIEVNNKEEKKKKDFYGIYKVCSVNCSRFISHFLIDLITNRDLRKDHRHL
jgi:hypothetical protein